VAARPLPARRSLPAVAAERALPVVGSSLAMAAAGFATEYALRLLANRALSSLVQPMRRAMPVASRTVVTEFVVIERVRRR
jgi:hypothetical protein